MGLDMFLTARKLPKLKFAKGEILEQERQEDGLPVKAVEMELGYWRKHPDLHGYIVKRFADGVDECQKIDLGQEDIMAIMEAVKSDKLPKTTGFFFGDSGTPGDEWYEGVKEETLETLERALTWLEEMDSDYYRFVYYQASW